MIIAIFILILILILILIFFVCILIMRIMCFKFFVILINDSLIYFKIVHDKCKFSDLRVSDN